MALKPCRECRGAVSTETRTCPHCGVSNPTPAAQKDASRDLGALAGCWALAFVAPLALGLFVCAGVGSDPAPQCGPNGLRPAGLSDYRAGTQIYHSGELYGTVEEIEHGFSFPDGSRGTGVVLRFPSGRSNTVKANLGQFGYEVRC